MMHSSEYDHRYFSISPVKVKDLPAFLAAVEPIARDMAAGELRWALARNARCLIQATAIGAGVDKAWLEEQTPDVLIDLAARVLEVNADFFVRSVLPKVTEAAERLATLTASGGTNGSHDSSDPASATTP